jgi:hypothetical protein
MEGIFFIYYSDRMVIYFPYNCSNVTLDKAGFSIDFNDFCPGIHLIIRFSYNILYGYYLIAISLAYSYLCDYYVCCFYDNYF